MNTAPQVPGFRWAGIEAGIRKRPGKPDLALLVADEPAACAGVFTLSSTAAAPVILSRPKANLGRARAVVMNAGCANACTGEPGLRAAEQMAASLERLGIPSADTLIASTGVIGALLPVERIEAASERLLAAARPDGIGDFARAIMTTDTRPKIAARTGAVGGRNVTVAGVAKGAGMIMPDMATMLSCVVTDAAAHPAVLAEILRTVVRDTFNAVTVDGDTSTNDTVYLLAGGRAGNETIGDATSADYAELQTLVFEVCLELAKTIAADGEGATKFVEVRVAGARDAAEADLVARRIANSPLVKTAWHAADANWGRIMATVGVCLPDADASRIGLAVDDVEIVRDGLGLGEAAEQQASGRMSGPSFVVHVRLGRGPAARSVYTCDFSAEYVRINAEYRT